MKKILALCLALTFTLFFETAINASTIPVNVEPGSSVTIAKQLRPTDPGYNLTGNFGITEQILLNADYGTQSKTVTLGARYEIQENMALKATYAVDPSKWTGEFLMKQKLKNSLFLVEALEVEGNDYIITGQVESLLGKAGVLNAGLKLQDPDTLLLLGGEFFLGGVTIGLDYSVPFSNLGDSVITIFIDIAF